MIQASDAQLTTYSTQSAFDHATTGVTSGSFDSVYPGYTGGYVGKHQTMNLGDGITAYDEPTGNPNQDYPNVFSFQANTQRGIERAGIQISQVFGHIGILFALDAPVTAFSLRVRNYTFDSSTGHFHHGDPFTVAVGDTSQATGDSVSIFDTTLNTDANGLLTATQFIGLTDPNGFKYVSLFYDTPVSGPVYAYITVFGPVQRGTFSPVPEPSSFAVLALGGGFLLRRRVKRSR